MTRFRLDPDGDAPLAEGYLAVSSEVDFLHHAAEGGALQVRGESLCRWVEAFCRGRAIPFDRVQSPVQSLLAAFPELTRDDASRIAGRLEAEALALPGALSPEDLLLRAYPEGPWAGPTSIEHAARWLLWLDEVDPPIEWRPVLARQAGLWRRAVEFDEAAGVERRCYAAHDAASALALLEEWLGLSDGSELGHAARFPLDVPPRWRERARSRWRERVTPERGETFFRLRPSRPLPRVLLTSLAEETARYYRVHKGELTPAKTAALEGYLPPETGDSLRGWCPPSEPGEVPSSPAQVLHWFASQYLPYRKWEARHGDGAAHDLVDRLARRFMEWYLRDYYPPALLATADPHLAVVRSQRMAAGRDRGVLFWVVFDGLHVEDARFLMSFFEGHPRLSALSRDPVAQLAFSPIPTVTRFCKPALLDGRPPLHTDPGTVSALFPDAEDFNARVDPEERMASAREGEVFLWRVSEPDETYHKPMESERLRTDARSLLAGFARSVERAALAVPDGLKLRVMISTDHGRLLSSGDRRLEVPPRMESHGRAAWGPSGRSFPPEGVLTDESAGIAYLCGERFGLGVDCAVPLGRDVFRTNDGRSGVMEFPHGGVYPEEVIVPWIEMGRDLDVTLPPCRLVGKARAGASGQVRLTLENPLERPLTFRSLRLDLGAGEAREVPLEGVAPPLSPAETTFELENWPSALQLGRARAEITLSAPEGSVLETGAELDLQSEEMYTRDSILEDL